MPVYVQRSALIDVTVAQETGAERGFQRCVEVENPLSGESGISIRRLRLGEQGKCVGVDSRLETTQDLRESGGT